MKKLVVFALAATLITGVSMTASAAEDARSLTQRQRDALVQHAQSVTPEKRQELRDDPDSRSQFVRDASMSLSPDQRKDLEARFATMSEQQRVATLRSVFEEARTRYQSTLSE